MPLPLVPTVRGLKFAATVISSFTVRMQGATPLQPPPLQPVNVESLAGVANKVISQSFNAPLAPAVPQLIKVSIQSFNMPLAPTPQLIPGGELVTTPLPAPRTSTFNVPLPPTVCGIKFAAMVVSASTVKMQGVVLPQPPPFQPPKTEPLTGVTNKETEQSFNVPLAPTVPQLVKVSMQSINIPLAPTPQLIPEGELVTAPLPVPRIVTFKIPLAPVVPCCFSMFRDAG